MIQRMIKCATPFLIILLTHCASSQTSGAVQGTAQNISGQPTDVQGEEHYTLRDGLRIYLWEKHKSLPESTFADTGKVALLVHGGTWSGRPDFDLQIRDYSLMDFLAKNDYDVWAIDIHGYGHSDKTEKDWSDAHSAAADIASAVEYITKLRGVSKVYLLGWSVGTQRAGLFAMQHPERVAKLILYAPHWKTSAEDNTRVRKRIENGGRPLTHYRTNTEEAARSDFIAGDLAHHPQYEEDVVAAFAKVALATDPQSPNSFVYDSNLPMQRSRVARSASIREVHAVEQIGKARVGAD